MKKTILLILLLSGQLLYSANNFSLKPILLNFHGITGKDSTIIAYGNYGSYMISYDGDKTWVTKKAFDKGLINKMFIEGDRIVAFTNDGQIAVSYDNANSWEQKPSIDILSLENDKYNYTYIIATKKGYVIRKRQNIYFVNKDLKLVKSLEYPIQDYLFPIGETNNELKTLTYDNNQLLVPNDSINLLYFDEDFNQMNNINIKEKLKLECKDCRYTYTILTDSIYMYVTLFSGNYKIKKDFSEYEKLISKETTNDGYLYAIINDKLIFKYAAPSAVLYYSPNDYDSLDVYLNRNKYKDVAYNVRDYDPMSMQEHYYDKINDKVYIVTPYNTLNIFENFSKPEEHKYKYVSFGQYHNLNDMTIFKVGDKLFSTDKSENNFNITFATFKVNSNIFDINFNFDRYNIEKEKNYKNNRMFYYKYFQYFKYNEKDSSILLGMRPRVVTNTEIFMSKDMGRNYTYFKLLPDSLRIMNVNLLEHNQFNFNKKLGYDFMNHVNLTFENQTTIYRSNFVLVNDTMKLITRTRLDNEFSYLGYYIDTNNIVSFGKEYRNYMFNIKTTYNKGKSWEVLKEYPEGYNLIDQKELEYKGRAIWAIASYDVLTNILSLEVVDLETRNIKTLFSQELTDKQSGNLNFIAFDASKDKFYLSFYDTLMVSRDIFDDNPKWETFNYPNNGRVNKKFQVFDTTIFARYADDRNDDNVYWMNGIDLVGDITSVEKTEEINYLYIMPPYPNPTTSEITTEIYWDSSIDINNSDIAVFDLNGNKVSSKENLSLEQLDYWSGNIKWNCVGFPKGTYLIKIHHGNNTKSVKVVVND